MSAAVLIGQESLQRYIPLRGHLDPVCVPCLLGTVCAAAGLGEGVPLPCSMNVFPPDQATVPCRRWGCFFPELWHGSVCGGHATVLGGNRDGEGEPPHQWPRDPEYVDEDAFSRLRVRVT